MGQIIYVDYTVNGEKRGIKERATDKFLNAKEHLKDTVYYPARAKVKAAFDEHPNVFIIPALLAVTTLTTIVKIKTDL